MEGACWHTATKMTAEKVRREIEIPEKVDASVKDSILVISGQKGSVERNLRNKKVSVKVDGSKIVLEAERNTKREKKLLGTFSAHIKNMIQGVIAGHVYRMKICSGHFPMNVSVSNKELLVKNFLGEKVPRRVKVPDGVSIKIEGSEITIESPDKEKAGGTASAIEEGTKRKGFDKRIFQDGIFITEKDGKRIK